MKEVNELCNNKVLPEQDSWLGCRLLCAAAAPGVQWLHELLLSLELSLRMLRLYQKQSKTQLLWSVSRVALIWATYSERVFGHDRRW